MKIRPAQVLAVTTIAAAALAYTFLGLLPGRVLCPLDLLADTGPWKASRDVRVPVSNHLLSDPVLQFVPWDNLAREALGQGHIPWRDPYAGPQGGPLFANPQTALLSPFTWPRLVCGLRGWAPTVFLKLLVAGIGCLWLAREWGATYPEAAISGLAYSLSGFSIVWGLHPHTNVFACLPWLTAAVFRLYRRQSASGAALTILCAALAASGGHPETLAVSALAIAVLLALEVFQTPAGAPKSEGARTAVLAILCLLSGVLLLGVQLVPFVHLLRGSHIVAARLHGPSPGVRWAAIAGQVVPGFLGSPLKGEIDLTPLFPRGENFNARNQAFLGVVSLVVLCLGGRRLPVRFRRGLIVGVAALAACWSLPAVSQLLGLLPISSLLAPQYWSAAFLLCAAPAVGPAVSAAVLSHKRRWFAALLLAVGIGFLAAGLWASQPSHRPLLEARAREGIALLRKRGHLRLPEQEYERRLAGYLGGAQSTARRRLILPALCWTAAGLALAAGQRGRKALTLALVGELIAFGWGYIPAIRASEIPKRPEVLKQLQAADPGRFLVLSLDDVYPPNLPTLDHLRDLRSYDLLESEERFRDLGRCGVVDASGRVTSQLGPEAEKCLAALGVRFILSWEDVPGCQRRFGSAPPEIGVYELPDVRPAAVPLSGPPEGLQAGLLVSAAGLVLAATLCLRAGRALSRL
jgi:hypothetical protein